MEEQDPEAERRADRRRLQDLPEKFIFLADASMPRGKHRLSNRAFAEACGRSESWLKSAKDRNRRTLSLDFDVEVKLAELCGFDPSWPEWVSGSAAAFQTRYLTGSSQAAQGLTPEDVAFIRSAVSEKKQLDATTEQKLQALSREIGETREVIASFFGRLEESGGSTENWQLKLL